MVQFRLSLLKKTTILVSIIFTSQTIVPTVYAQHVSISASKNNVATEIDIKTISHFDRTSDDLPIDGVDYWLSCRELCGGVANYCPPPNFMPPAHGMFVPGELGESYNLCHYWRDNQINPLICQPMFDRRNTPDLNNNPSDLFEDNTGRIKPRGCSSLANNLDWDVDSSESSFA